MTTNVARRWIFTWTPRVSDQLPSAATFQVALLILGMVLLFFGRKPDYAGDDIHRWISLKALLEQAEIGRSPYSFIGTLFAIPFYSLGRFIGQVDKVGAYFNLVQFIVVGSVIFVLLGHRIGWPLARTMGLLILSASMFPLHLGYFNAEVFTTLFVATGILLVSTRPVLAAVILGLGVGNTHATFPSLVLAACWMAWRWKKASLLLLAAPALILVLGENMLKFGNPLLNPYLQGNAGVRTILPYSGLPGFSYPLVFGVLSILFSMGKGLMFFVPGLLAAFNKPLFAGPLRPVRIELETMLVFLAGMVLVYGKWWAWYGGAAWGPRFFLFAYVPAALLLAGCFVQIRSLLGASLLSGAVLFQTWATIQSVLYDMRDLGSCFANEYALEFMCWYVPEFSPLFRQFVVGFGDPHWARLPFAVWCATTAILLCLGLMWRIICDLGRQNEAQPGSKADGTDYTK